MRNSRVLFGIGVVVIVLAIVSSAIAPLGLLTSMFTTTGVVFLVMAVIYSRRERKGENK